MSRFPPKRFRVASLRHRRVSPSASLRSQLLTAAVLAAVGARLPAQLQFAQSAAPSGLSALAVGHAGDIDGDGDLDMAVGLRPLSGGRTFRIYKNDGRGAFTDVTPIGLPFTVGGTASLAFGDVDGDGDLDLVLGSYLSPVGAQNRLLINDGTGAFTEQTGARLPMRQDPTTSIAFGDFDGDGDLDLVEGNGGSYGSGGWRNRLLVNDGSGVFTDVTTSQMPNVTDMTSALAVGDVDGDGDLDLVFGNGYYDGLQCLEGEQNRLLVNDGTGTFTDVTATQLPSDNTMTHGAAFGDVDGDGDLDLVFGNDNYSGGQDGQERLLLNDGTGVFTDGTAGRLPPLQDSTFTVALADIDEDGDADILVGNAVNPSYPGPPGWRLLANDGTGTFSDVTAQRLPVQSTLLWSIEVADVDGDGDADVIGGVWGGLQVHRNLLRQLDAPAAPVVGQSYQLDVYARYGVPRLFDVALPYVSFASASIVLPNLGTVGIDLAQAAPLPLMLIPQPAGVASTAVAIPNNPVLVGVELYAQALHVPYPLPPRLMNVTFGIVQ